MIQSHLNSDIEYSEERELDDSDIDFDAQMWSYEIMDVEVYIALGKKHTIDNIDTFAIYLIKDDIVDCKIGLFEVIDSDSYRDSDGDIDINLLSKPLIFSFVTKSLLNDSLDKSLNPSLDQSTNNSSKSVISPLSETDNNSSSPKSSSEVEPSPKIDGIFTITKPEQSPLKEQTKAIADEEREIIQDKSADWIAKYLENSNLTIQNVPGDGDCYFHVISQALSSIGKNISVQKIRRLLSEKVTDDMFQQYLSLYKSTLDELENINTKGKQLKTKMNDYTQLFKQSIKKSEQIKLQDLSLQTKTQYGELQKEKQEQNILLQDFKFMEGVNTYEEFKEAVQNSTYYADDASIPIIESILNIKTIIFSKECYDSGDCSVIQCGIVPKEMKDINPDYYVLASHVGNHYDLIKFKERSIFKFQELLYTIRLKIVELCLEKGMGPFAEIKEFKDMKNQLLLKEPDSSLSVSPEIGLFNPNTVFRLYYKAPQVRNGPGGGKGETISIENKSKFAKLNKIKNWRQILSNMYKSEFVCDKYRWSSLEHYIQGNKFKNVEDIYKEFTIESNSVLSKDPELARYYGLGKMKNGKRVRPKDVKLDPTYDESIAYTNAIECKINQDNIFKQALIETNDAKLVLQIPYKPVREQIEMMTIRSKLKVST
tara:strand:+ start:3118 stop:5079 length:1962 start_codon:yes stop_codon:yes gene_type:complete